MSQEDEKRMKSKYGCIGNVANWSKVEPVHLFDKPDAFIPEVVQTQFAEASPKASAMLQKIAEVDARDMEEFGHKFKHMIFVGNPNVIYGSKIVASLLIANGFQLAFHAADNGQLIHKPLETLQQLSADGTNIFTMLASKPVYGKTMTPYFKQRTLKIFNLRKGDDAPVSPGKPMPAVAMKNNHGELVRFILVDSGFREGIDLFDIKYIHLFEPTPIKADEKQAIGRGTRFCGQKGIYFDPKSGWPLHVFRYEVDINPSVQEVLQADKFMSLQLRYSQLDPRLINFAVSLDDVVAQGAVDKWLTQPVHDFKTETGTTGGADTEDENVVEDIASVDGGAVVPRVPTKFMTYENMQRFVKKYYKRFKYPTPKLENACVPKPRKDKKKAKAAAEGGAAEQIIASFTPTQDFMRHFFRPESAVKGMLVWSSVGTGKTCSGIAVASDSFEKEGYTILWVTRHTLKSDVAKNQFGIVCNVGLQQRLRDGLKVTPKDLPNAWMKPISYKQFSNMLLKKNSIYSEMVARNGEEDPLYKTLIIIDEAHKLYTTELSATEKPDMEIMEAMLQNSYTVSGKDSARLLLMTGTPYTKSPMEMISLLNLLRPGVEGVGTAKFPTDYDTFAKEYLDDNSTFTAEGRAKFLDEISGYISYLDRTKDARSFSYPIMHNVFVNMSMAPLRLKEDKFNKYTRGIKNMKEEIRAAKKQDKAYSAECLDNVKQQDTHWKKEAKQVKEQAAQRKRAATAACNKYANNSQKVDCKEKVDREYEYVIAQITKALDIAKLEIARMKEECKATPNVASKLQDMERLEAEYNYIKKQRLDLKTQAMRLKINLAGDKKAAAKMQAQKKKEYAEIAEIKDPEERKKRRTEYAEKYANFNPKASANDAKMIRQKLQNIKVQMSLLSEKIGTKFPPDMSQETALRKRCNFSEMPEPRSHAHSRSKPKSPPPPPREPSASASSAASPMYNGPSADEFQNILNKKGAEGAKKAYYKLTMKYHPDKHPSSPVKNDAIFKELQKAWDKTKTQYGITGGWETETEVQAA